MGSELKGAWVVPEGRLRGMVLSSCWTELLSLVTAMRVWSKGFPARCKCNMQILRSATCFIKAVMYSCEGGSLAGYVGLFGTPDFVYVAMMGQTRTKMRREHWREHTACAQNLGVNGLDPLFENDRPVNSFTGRMGGTSERRSTEKLLHLIKFRCDSS